MFRNLKISTKIVLVTVSIVICVVIASGLASDMVTRDATRTEAFNKLSAAREMKARQIEDYFLQIRNQVLTYSENHMIVNAMVAFSQSFYSQESGSQYNQAVVLKQYYQDEFLPRFSAHSQSTVDLMDYWPEDTTAQLFQYLYLAENSYQVGQKHKLNATQRTF